MNNKLIIGLIALFAIVFVGLSSVFIVNEREQALVVQFGKIQRPVQEAGLHFKIPLMQQVIFLEKRVLSLDVRPQEVLAADQRRILVDSFARFRIVDPVLRYQAAANDRIAADLLEKIMESTVRQVLAKEPMQNI